MAHIGIIGTGNTGQVIAGLAGKGGNTVELIGGADADKAVTADAVVLAAGEKTSWTGGFALAQ